MLKKFMEFMAAQLRPVIAETMYHIIGDAIADGLNRRAEELKLVVSPPADTPALTFITTETKTDSTQPSLTFDGAEFLSVTAQPASTDVAGDTAPPPPRKRGRPRKAATKKQKSVR